MGNTASILASKREYSYWEDGVPLQCLTQLRCQILNEALHILRLKIGMCIIRTQSES